MSAQMHAESSLQKAIAALLRREIAAFLALSLIFAVPLSCQQHDMMSLLDLHMHHDLFDATHTDHTNHTAHDHHSGKPQLDLPLPVSALAATLAAFAGVLPPDRSPYSLILLAVLVPTDTLYPSQRQLIPPDQPPRSL